METSNQENILKQAGLSEEQASTYEALLEKGPQKASSLSTWTGIKRGLIYKVLEQLENMGLVEKKGGTGTVAVFYPSHPSVLLDKMDRDKKNLELAKGVVSLGIGNLSSKYNLLAGKPNVRFFEGEDSIVNVTGDYPQNEKLIRQIVDISSALSGFKDATLGYLDKRVKLGIEKQMLLSDTPENREYAEKGSDLTEFRFLPKGTVVPTAIQTYENKVTMLTLNKDKKIGFIIEDKDIALGMQNIFDALWSLSKANSQDSLEK
ncbi:MAG: TrmB family transcriptional regulator [Candidatus Paceibacterota bacterium]